MPLSLRWGSVTAVHERLDDLVRLEVDDAPCIAFPRLTGPVEPGDVVLVNTLTQAGYGEIVYANLTRGIGLAGVEGAGTVALPSTPGQTAVPLGEATLGDTAGLEGLPVLCCSRHSQVAPACAGLGGGRVAYAQLGGGALTVSLSDAVRALRERGAIESVVSVAPCIDGDVHCLTVGGALLWAKHAGVKAVVCAPGPGSEDVDGLVVPAPGIVAAATAASAASALDGRPILVASLSFDDHGQARPRLSPESHEALSLVSGRTVVAWPVGLAPPADVDVVVVDVEGWDVACVGLPLMHEGRGPDDDPWFFKAAYAAGLVVDWGLL
jgi:hypothetical protein